MDRDFLVSRVSLPCGGRSLTWSLVHGTPVLCGPSSCWTNTRSRPFPEGNGHIAPVHCTPVPLGAGYSRTVCGTLNRLQQDQCLWYTSSCESQLKQDECPWYTGPYGYWLQLDGLRYTGSMRNHLQQDHHPQYTSPNGYRPSWMVCGTPVPWGTDSS